MRVAYCSDLYLDLWFRELGQDMWPILDELFVEADVLLIAGNVAATMAPPSELFHYAEELEYRYSGRYGRMYVVPGPIDYSKFNTVSYTVSGRVTSQRSISYTFKGYTERSIASGGKLRYLVGTSDTYRGVTFYGAPVWYSFPNQSEFSEEELASFEKSVLTHWNVKNIKWDNSTRPSRTRDTAQRSLSRVTAAVNKKPIDVIITHYGPMVFDGFTALTKEQRMLSGWDTEWVESVPKKYRKWVTGHTSFYEEKDEVFCTNGMGPPGKADLQTFILRSFEI